MNAGQQQHAERLAEQFATGVRVQCYRDGRKVMQGTSEGYSPAHDDVTVRLDNGETTRIWSAALTVA